MNWIKVKEKKPKFYKDVALWNGCDPLYSGFLLRGDESLIWHTTSGDYPLHAFTHWAEIEAPKEES